jgi:hypothetical protein
MKLAISIVSICTFFSAISANATEISYTPSCQLICYKGCGSPLAPITGQEFVLQTAGQLSGNLFVSLPKPFDSFKVLVIQEYGSANGGSPNYIIEMNIQSESGQIQVDKQTYASLDMMELGGKVSFDLDLQPSSDLWLRAECSVIRTK